MQQDNNYEKLSNLRREALSDASLSEAEFILIGAGGGLAQTFDEFIIVPNGEVIKVSYNRIPDIGDIFNYQASLLLRGENNEAYAGLKQFSIEKCIHEIKLEHTDAGSVRITALTNSEQGQQHLVWAPGGNPTPPKELVEFDLMVRRFLSEAFSEQHLRHFER